MADMAATVATDTARGLLMLRPSPATAMVATDTADTAVDMVVMAVATTAMARGPLMPSLRPRPRLSPVTAVDTAMVAMVATDMAVATTARGRLRLSPATATAATARGLLSQAMVAMVATGATVAMAATATAGATATGVSYHQIRRSELSQ